MRSGALLASRVVLGGYLATHGAQKLFGVFGGHGLDQTGAGFDAIGLSPGKPMAALAGAAEFGGGLLTAAGVADPLGPLAVAGAMSVAVAVHRNRGPLAANGGYELALTNLGFAVALGVTGSGALRLGPRLPARLAVVAGLGAATFTAVSLVKVLSARPASSAKPGALAPEPHGRISEAS